MNPLLMFLVLILFALLYLGYRRMKRLEANVDALGQALATEIERRMGENAPLPPTKSTDRRIRDALDDHVNKFHRK